MSDTDDLSLKLDGIRDTLRVLRTLLEEVTSRLGRIEDAIAAAEAPPD